MAKPANVSNQYDKDVVASLLAKIDGFESDLASERGASMSRCRNIRESISNVFKEAKTQGIPSKEFRILVKIRHNEADNVKLYEELEPDQQQNLEMLAQVTAEVMDLPLWRASGEKKSVPGVDVDAPVHKRPMFN